MEPSPRLTTPPPPLPPPTSTYDDHRDTVDDSSLQSTWYHRAWVASGCITVAISLVKCITAAIDSRTWLQPIIAGWLGYLLADLSSGVYHWAIDNYGSASTPIFGFQIESFQYHHESPWTLTRSQFAHNIHKLARGITFAVLPLDLFCNGPFLHGFVALYSGCIMFSQHFHYWAHDTKSRLPRLVVALQDAGLLLSRSQHGVHHRPPYNKNYCIVSGVWNELLSAYKVFETLETFLFLKLGVRPRSGNEPKSAWVDPKGD
ncbi:fatty acid desaturase 4, chloroplastic-like [Rhododendron vialii]|uniref:fatty acid desaturase 4, chloroplastic-like n=1 Tax=Rhododendron vialii TaxID=182163 RepID=UPI00265DB2D5|nr:fatty acid desaturase 4, chloroplastic-like [Rhododendron vialii]